MKVKDCPKRPPHPFHGRYKPVEEDLEFSSDGELAPEFEEESQSGWISGAAENDGSEGSCEEDGHEI